MSEQTSLAFEEDLHRWHYILDMKERAEQLIDDEEYEIQDEFVKSKLNEIQQARDKAKKLSFRKKGFREGKHGEKDIGKRNLILSSKPCSSDVNVEIEEGNINLNILPLGVCDCGCVIPDIPYNVMFAQGRCPQCNAKITAWDDGYRKIKVCKGWIRVGLWGENGGELNRKT